MNASLRAGALAAVLFGGACASFDRSPPPASEAYASFLVGRVANWRADHQAASDRYFEALLRVPGDAALFDGALTAALATGDADRARLLARMAGRRGASLARAHLVRAADALAAGRFRQAEDALGRVEDAAAAELTARLMLAWAQAGQGRLDGVMTELEPLSAMRPYGGLFAYQQAMGFDFAGRDAQALSAYSGANVSGLWLAPGIERHADLLARTGAREQAGALLAVSENRAGSAALAHALARLQAGQNPAAARLNPAHGAAIGLYGLAAILLRESDPTNALATLTLALMLDPGFDAARLAAAEAQSGIGHSAAARAALAAIGADSPEAGGARVMEAWLLLGEGRAEEALTLARANAETGLDPRGRRALADLYRNLERWGEAEPIYSELIAQHPRDWRLYFARGAAREQLDRWREAEADLRRALELSPEQPEVMNYLGYSWVDRGERLDEGMALIQRAAEIRPLSGAIIDSLGWAYFRRGDFARALEYLERAVEMEPADAVLNDHLGDAFWRMGRRIEARFQWRRALTLSPTQAMRAEIEAKLEHGLPALAARRAGRR